MATIFRSRMRLTKIICTIGPACRTHEKLNQLLEGGMNIARLNFSHGNHEEHGENIAMIRKACAETGKNVAIMLDTKGSEIRTVDVKEKIQVKEGDTVVFAPNPQLKTSNTLVVVDHAGFVKDAKTTKVIFVDNGEMIFEVLEVRSDCVVTKAQSSGEIGSRRHVNLPSATISLPSVTEKDWDDIAFGCAQDLDFVALSFVRSAQDVEEVRDFVKKKGGHLQIVSKIENATAVQNIDEIIAASDGVMVARGDLGSEIPFEKVPAVQDDIVARCRKAGKPVIVATHMLESMIHAPLPTRAEVTDIAHAAVTGSDCTMLSGETASGKFPKRALETMHRVLLETEKAGAAGTVTIDEHPSIPPQAHAVSAVTMATSLSATAILVFTRSGGIAYAVSRLRPSMPVFSFTDDPHVERALNMCFAVQPQKLELKDHDETILAGVQLLQKKGLVASGDHVVIISPAAEHDRSARTVRSFMVP